MRTVSTAKKRKGNGLMSGASVLATGSVIAKVIGALYRIPLTNVLGAEGMGMYQLVFPVFALFMVLSSAGVPTALSRIVAEKRALGEGVKKYLFASLSALSALISAASISTPSSSPTETAQATYPFEWLILNFTSESRK